MEHLIPIQTRLLSEQPTDFVNARELHSFLEIGRDFSNWIKARIKQYCFSHDEDYICVENLSSPKRASAKSRVQKVNDYFITLDMAKELAMVERNEKGREARRYFINCERQLKASNFQSPSIENQTTQHLAIDPAQFNQANEATRTMAKLLEGNILALANKRSKNQANVECIKIGEEVNNYLGVRKLDEATPAQLEKGLIFIQTAIEGEYLGRANNPTNEYVASMERRIGFYEYNMKLIHSHTTAMKRDFHDAIFPTLKTTNPRLYGIARERLHIAHMSSIVY